MAQKDTKISVLGDGGWGTALSLLLAQKRYSVCLWGAFSDYVCQVNKTRENIKFLPGFKIPKNVQLTSSLSDAARFSQLLVIAIPTQHVRSVLENLKNEPLKEKKFIIASKGIETKSLKILSDVLQEILGRVPLAVLSGPTIAREVALKMPTAVSVASKDARLLARVRELFSTETFRLYESQDVVGVELGGSLKNVIALGAGIVEGMGFGANPRAVVIARGLAEMARLGRKLGAHRETFMGLSGLGDLATTCLSPDSRNHWLGCEIGRGHRLKDILKKTEMVVEGVETAQSARKLAKKHDVKMPICESVCRILFENENPRLLLDALWNGGSSRERD